MRVVLDAMGSDDHPLPEIQAAVEAVKEFGDEILLVGNRDELIPLLKESNPNNLPIQVIHAPETFLMTDKISGSALRKSQNSMGVGMDLVKNGEADVFVTAGNTGGAMAIGLARFGRIKGVKRPALCAVIPVKNGFCAVTDVGANAICKPEFLVQFGKMGSVYVKELLGVKNPRVGLISNGEEAGKGNDLVKAAYPLMEASGLNFYGNVEGKEIFNGEVDVAVSDGFTGNVFIKGVEAVAKLLVENLKEELMVSTRTKIGALLAKPAFDALRKTLDPAEIGAIPLLGLDGLVFVGHGRSNARAMLSAIRMARQAVETKMMDNLRKSIAESL
jgi:glycerol-3-phosphate acyltransferase PlsX